MKQSAFEVSFLHLLKSMIKCDKLQLIYVTWAGVICLICTHEHKGAQHSRVSADISGISSCYICYVTLPACEKLLCIM